MTACGYGIWIAIGLLAPRGTNGFSRGNISSVCETMAVKHGSTKAQTGPFPYRITPNALTYTCGDTVSVFLTSPPELTFQGFMCQVRTQQDVISTGLIPPWNYKMKEWCGKGRALSQSDSSNKTWVRFTWKPTETNTSVHVVCTVLQTQHVFWEKKMSAAIDFVETEVCSGFVPALPEFLLLISSIICSFNIAVKLSVQGHIGQRI